MKIGPMDYEEMEESLSKIAKKKFGNEDFYIDKTQNEIPDHLHWHARPNGWKFPLKFRIKNKIRSLIKKCLDLLPLKRHN